MADKGGDTGTRVVATLAAFAATFVTRKVITTAWKRITGKEPPSNPEDPDIDLLEAVGWAAFMGVAVGTARLLATRAATRRLRSSASEPAEEAGRD
jgi:hypothetical protein